MRKDILNYEGLYQADSAGFIIKISRPQKDKRYGEFTKEVVLKPHYTKMKNGSKGYAIVTLSKNGIKNKVLVHRVVYETFKGAIKEDYVIDHLNGNKQDNRIENLEQCTRSENTRRAFTLGFMKNEFNRSFCKTTPKQFELLIKCLSRGVSKRLSEHIAEIPFGTTKAILAGNSYKSYKSKIENAINIGKKVNTEVNKGIKKPLSP